MHVARIRTVKGEKVYESHLPPDVIGLIRLALQGQTVRPVAEAFEIVASHHHGHVQAVLTAMRQLKLEDHIA